MMVRDHPPTLAIRSGIRKLSLRSGLSSIQSGKKLDDPPLVLMASESMEIHMGCSDHLPEFPGFTGC